MLKLISEKEVLQNSRHVIIHMRAIKVFIRRTFDAIFKLITKPPHDLILIRNFVRSLTL